MSLRIIRNGTRVVRWGRSLRLRHPYVISWKKKQKQKNRINSDQETSGILKEQKDSYMPKPYSQWEFALRYQIIYLKHRTVKNQIYGIWLEPWFGSHWSLCCSVSADLITTESTPCKIRMTTAYSPVTRKLCAWLDTGMCRVAGNTLYLSLNITLNISKVPSDKTWFWV